MAEDYTQRFASSDAVAEYLDLYSGDKKGYANALYQLEKRLLDEIIPLQRAGSMDYLDFATGTGRIIAHLEDRFASSTGVDISQEMIAACKRNVRVSVLRCEDITGVTASQQYDVITAFRFFLNAGSGLGGKVLSAIGPRLATEGRLVVNNHGRPRGTNILRIVKHRLGFRSKQAVLSDKNFEALFASHGLKVRNKVFYGVLGGKLFNILGYERGLRLEQALVNTWVARVFATCAVYEFGK